MKALSIRSPWWAWILYGGKDIENRDWRTNYRGRIFIHASKFWHKGEISDDQYSAVEMARSAGFTGKLGLTCGEVRALCGHVVGTVEIVDCVNRSDSPWFVGKYGFVLKNPRPLKPFPVKGSLGLFDVDGWI